MVARKGITTMEIAETYGYAPTTVQRTWARHPDWPEPIGKRGRWFEYSPEAVDTVVRRLFAREGHERQGGPNDLLTQMEIAEYTGLKPGTIRADISRGRISEPDETEDDGTKLWKRSTIDTDMATRQRYRRSERKGDAPDGVPKQRRIRGVQAEL